MEVLNSTKNNWIQITNEPLDIDKAFKWAIVPNCGAVVVFAGTVRDYSQDRSGIERLEYEAYEEQAYKKLHEIADHARNRWPEIGRIGLLHRIGSMDLEEVSVLVVVSTPHRPQAFEAAKYCIDTLKATVPIWKKEFWQDRQDWAQGSQEIKEIEEI